MNKINTKFGELDLTPTEKDHIYLAGVVTVRNIRWKISVHFHLWTDGLFHIGEQNKDNRQSFYGNREGPDWGDITPAARVAVSQPITDALNEWAKANQASIQEAENIYINRSIETRKTLLAELEAAANEIKAELKQLDSGVHLPNYAKYHLKKNN